MPVPISNLSTTWTSSSVNYTGLGLNASIINYGPNTKLVDFKMNGNSAFSVDAWGSATFTSRASYPPNWTIDVRNAGRDRYTAAAIGMTLTGAADNFAQTTLMHGFVDGVNDDTSTGFFIQRRRKDNLFLRNVYQVDYRSNSHAWFTTSDTPTMYLNENLMTLNGNLFLGKPSSNSSYIAFPGTYSDGQAQYTHSFIGERIHTPAEGSEILIFKGNDFQSTNPGPDRVRVLAAEFHVDTYNDYLSGSFDHVGANTSIVKNRFKVDNNGELFHYITTEEYAGITTRSLDASASTFRGLYHNFKNENAVTLSSMLCSVQTDGSSTLSWTITHPGDRTVDRRSTSMVLYPEANGVGAALEIKGKNGGGTNGGIYLSAQSGNSGESFGVIYHNTSSSSGTWYWGFSYGANWIGSIVQNGSTGVVYNTASDYRLKENVVRIPNAITRLMELKPSRFNFISEPDRTVDGFLAHEVQEVIPEAITGVKDEVDADGNPRYQGIDQSKLVPLLTAALQDALTKIDQLEQRVAALENS